MLHLALQCKNSVTIKHFLVTTRDGKTTLTPATEVVPNDILEYQMTYVNTTNQPLVGIHVAACSSGTEYIASLSVLR